MGMRWAALGVDYETMWQGSPISLNYTMRFAKSQAATHPSSLCSSCSLTRRGRKFPSPGKRITIHEWLRYAPQESLSYYMFQSPRRAEKLYFDVIPQQVDDYLTYLENFAPRDG